MEMRYTSRNLWWAVVVLLLFVVCSLIAWIRYTITTDCEPTNMITGNGERIYICEEL